MDNKNADILELKAGKIYIQMLHFFLSWPTIWFNYTFTAGEELRKIMTLTAGADEDVSG